MFDVRCGAWYLEKLLKHLKFILNKNDGAYAMLPFEQTCKQSSIATQTAHVLKNINKLMQRCKFIKELHQVTDMFNAAVWPDYPNFCVSTVDADADADVDDDSNDNDFCLESELQSHTSSDYYCRNCIEFALMTSFNEAIMARKLVGIFTDSSFNGFIANYD